MFLLFICLNNFFFIKYPTKSQSYLYYVIVHQHPVDHRHPQDQETHHPTLSSACLQDCWTGGQGSRRAVLPRCLSFQATKKIFIISKCYVLKLLLPPSSSPKGKENFQVLPCDQTLTQYIWNTKSSVINNMKIRYMNFKYLLFC